MKHFKTILAVTASIFASSAYAQEYNGGLGTLTGAPVVTNNGAAVITQTGDNTVDPFQNTIVSTQQQTSTTSGAGSDDTDITINGITYTGTMNVSGSGSQALTVRQTQVNQYNPANVLAPPTVISTNTATTTNGAPVVTAVSASGSTGAAASYSSTLSTSGPVSAAGSVVATQNSSLLNSSGMTFEQRVGTATYNVTTGAVLVALPTAPTTSTVVNSAGLTTTGAISAASVSTSALNMNGGRITNLGAGTAATDAINLGQLNSAVATLNSSITTTNGRITTLAALVNDNQRRADAGTAVAVALSGGTFLPGKAINLTANVGHYEGETAISAQLGALLSENIAINAGVATGIGDFGGTAVRGGFTFGF